MTALSTPTPTPTPAAASILDAALTVVAGHGLEGATVRAVATAAGVAIGTVQHHFATKDALLAAAFGEVVRRVRARIDVVAAEPGPPRQILGAVLCELLPLDARRTAEIRVQIAFSAHAVWSPDLSALQREVLTDVRAALAQAFGAWWPGDAPRCRRAAAAALALTDGLALHALSVGTRPHAATITGVLDAALDALVAA